MEEEKRQFQVHLVQHEWVTTEVFNETAATEKDAIATVRAFIDEHKELGDKEFKLEAIDVTPDPVEEEPEAPTPEEINETGDSNEQPA